MKKISNIALYSIIFAIIFVVGTVVAFLLTPEYTPYFWISYVFTVLALAGLFVSGFALRDKFKNVFANIPFIYIAWIYLIIEIGVTIVFGILLPLPVTIYVVIHLILFAVFIILFILMIMGKRVIVDLREETTTQIQKKSNILEDAKKLNQLTVDLTGEEKAKVDSIIESLVDEIKYSDPIVPENLVPLDDEIDDLLSNLYAELEHMISSNNVDIDKLTKMTSKIKYKIESRNRMVMASK